MRRLYATRAMPRSSPSARSVAGASIQRSAGMRKSRCGVAGSSAVCQSRSVGGRASAGVGGTCHPRMRARSSGMKVGDLPTPALVVDAGALDAATSTTMAAALPGPRCRPHVKAHKCTSARARAGRCADTGASRARRHASWSGWRGGPRRRSAAREPDGRRRPASAAMAATRRAGHRRGRLGRDGRRRRRRRDPRGARRRERRHAALRLRARRRRARSPNARALAASRCAASWATRATSSGSPIAPNGRRRRPSAMAKLARCARGRRRRRRLRRRYRHLRHQHGRDRDPGRLVRADGHRLRRSSTSRSDPRCAVVATVDARDARSSRSPTAGSRRSAWTTATRRVEGGDVWFCSDEHVTFAPHGARPGR